MKKLDRFAIKYFLYALPVIAIFGYYDSQLSGHSVDAKPFAIQALYYLGLVSAGIWILISFYISAQLILSRTYRTKVLSALCFFQERDEREQLLSGQAARNAFLSTLGAIIFIFCISALKIAVYHVYSNNSVDGRTGQFSVGFAFDFTSEANPLVDASKIDFSQPHYLFNGFPLSKPTLLLLLILIQIFSYNYFLRQLTGAKKKATTLDL